LNHDLANYVGRTAVYVETQKMCVAVVSSVYQDEERVAAEFTRTPGTFMCRLRFVLNPGDDPIEEVLKEDSFPSTWKVEASDREFFPEADYWQVLFLFGGGVRIFFQPTFVSRFLAGDVSWLDEFFGTPRHRDPS
jgi:hypothetical protein